MKYKNRPEGQHENHSEHHLQENAEVAEFHNKRIHREQKIETKKESSNKPEGNYEYEQLIAEDASFNAKPMIEEAAFYIAEQRGFAPGSEMSDWLQAEARIEQSLRSTSTEERRKAGVEDRRR